MLISKVIKMQENLKNLRNQLKDHNFEDFEVMSVKGQVRPNGTLVLLIVLFFKNTMLFTGSQTDVVRRRYSSGCKGFQKNALMGLLPWS